MSPFVSRAAVSELARLLDAAAAGLAAPAARSAQAVALAGVAARLSAAAPALAAGTTVRPEFRDALRTRLLAVAAVQGIGTAAAPVRSASPVRAAGLEAAVSWSRARRGASVAVGAMASVVALAGVATAGTQSLPGDPFYGVKGAIESVELRLADGAVGRGRTHLQHADARLDEVAALARAGRTALVLETLEDMDRSTRTAAAVLVEAAQDGASTEPLQVLTTFAAEQDRALSALAPELPLAAQVRVASSLTLVDEVASDALGRLLDALPALPAVPVAPALPAVPGVPALPAVPAPALPAVPGVVPPVPAATTASPAPAPSPTPQPSARPTPQAAPASPQPRPSGGSGPSPQPDRTPSPAPSLEVQLPALPVPLPLPVPVPTSLPLPVPVPSLPVLPLPLPPLPALPLPVSPALPAVVPVAGVPGLLVAPTTAVGRPLPTAASGPEQISSL